jgi:hypothetical protein
VLTSLAKTNNRAPAATAQGGSSMFKTKIASIICCTNLQDKRKGKNMLANEQRNGKFCKNFE